MPPRINEKPPRKGGQKHPPLTTIIADKNDRYIVAEATLGETKIVFWNIYVTNDTTLQVHFLRNLSQSIINQYANERIGRGCDFNCALNDLDKRGGRSLELKKIIYRSMVDLWYRSMVE